MLERVKNVQKSQPKHPKQRRSIQQVVHEHVQISTVTTTINLTTPRTSRMDAVMERAAENIVFDLISIESPSAPTAIDPNSSFGNHTNPCYLICVTCKVMLWIIFRTERVCEPQPDSEIAGTRLVLERREANEQCGSAQDA